MQARFVAPCAELPAALAAALTPLLGADFCGQLSLVQITALKAASGLDESALRLALLPLAAAYSLAPISNFFVGAIAVGLSGRWYFGANMEFAGQGLTHCVHAEQAAICHAWQSGEVGLSDITINYSPCGHCRQFMNELTTARALRIALPDEVNTLADYLPHAFGPTDLGITAALMSEQAHPLAAKGSDDALWQAALAAATQSYAPYSHGYAGVALAFADGRHVTGRYAENAAFNPSLPPMQSALVYAHLQGFELRAVTRAVLVEARNAPVSQRDGAQATLRTISALTLEYAAR
ncbi:MAG: cytidine deaminase [Aeromonas sp.]